MRYWIPCRTLFNTVHLSCLLAMWFISPGASKNLYGDIWTSSSGEEVNSDPLGCFNSQSKHLQLAINLHQWLFLTYCSQFQSVKLAFLHQVSTQTFTLILEHPMEHRTNRTDFTATSAMQKEAFKIFKKLQEEKSNFFEFINNCVTTLFAIVCLESKSMTVKAVKYWTNHRR